MKAMVYKQFGEPEVLQEEEVEKPSPKDNEILIKNYSTSVTAGDWRLRGSIFPPNFWLIGRLMIGLFKPRKTILGQEFSGMVEAVGKDVQEFKPGDLVFGMDSDNMGAYAEYKTMTADDLVTYKPDNLSHDEAAVICFGGTTALIFLRDMAKIQKGEKVLIYGASGSVGTAAVQIARYFGAEITAVTSTPNFELVRSLGSDKCIDYTRSEFTHSGERYDIIFDTVGKTRFKDCKGSLKENGRYLQAVAGLSDFITMLWTSLVGSKKLITGVALGKKENILFLKQLIDEGHYKAVIDSIYPLEELVKAHRYAEEGHKKGNLVIKVAE